MTTLATLRTPMEVAFEAKSYKFCDPDLAQRAHQYAQQFHLSPEAFANQYDSFALVSDWNSTEVTAQRLKAVASYLETEQRKENARPKTGAAGGGATLFKGLPQAMKPTWEDLQDRVDFTPSAKRQALDPAATNPGTAAKAGTAAKPAPPGGLRRGQDPAAAAPTGTPQQQRQGATATAVAAGGPSAQQAEFEKRSNSGQVVALLHDHLPGPEVQRQQQQQAGGVAVRPLGQPPLDGSDHLFMMEVLEAKVHALDERILDFAEALTAATRHLPTAPANAVNATSLAAAGTPGPTPTPAPTPTPGPAAAMAAGTPLLPVATANEAALTPGFGAQTPLGARDVALAERDDSLTSGVVQALQSSVADVSQVLVWVAGRVVPEVEGAPLNCESLLLEGCREASGGARVRLDVSCLQRGYRLFPGQSVCAYGLNPLGTKFIAQRLVTHVPPPPLQPPPPSSGAAASGGGGGLDAATRAGGLSLVVAAGPYSVTDGVSYTPLQHLLKYCTTHRPDVVMLMGPFVDAEHPGLASGAVDRTAESVMQEEVLAALAEWRRDHPATTIALMPAVRDMTAVPVLPQPPLTAAAQAVGPADRVVALQNPSTVAVGPLVVGAGSSDLLKALSASELSLVPPGTTAERLPALASHVLGQRSFYPLYPAPPGACLDTSHYSQLQLSVTPDLLLLPSDLAPFAKVLQPSTWAAGAPPGLLPPEGGGSNTAASAAPVVVVNPGRLWRGAVGGTFAHVVVSPGAAPVLDRIRVEVKRV